jgi:hypothetical protein
MPFLVGGAIGLALLSARRHSHCKAFEGHAQSVELASMAVAGQ